MSVESQTLINNYRYNLIESWKSSDKIAYDFSKVNAECDDLFTGNFIEHRESILENTTNFDYYNNEFYV